jgi:hypothetical protein
VAIADGHNYRVQVFDSEGNYKRQFGTKGEDADGQFDCPSGLASDAHGNLLVADWTNRLQVFRPDGKHLCTRSDLGLHGESVKGIAWRADGDIAVANGEANNACVWFIAQHVIAETRRPSAIEQQECFAASSLSSAQTPASGPESGNGRIA